MTPPNSQRNPGSGQRPAERGEGHAITRVARDLGRSFASFILIPLIASLAIFIPVGITAVIQSSHQYDALTHFCRDEVVQDYLHASYWISTGATPNKFIQANQLRDQRLGQIQSCTVVARDNWFISFDHAVFTLKVTIRGVSYQGAVHLVSDNQIWQIESLDPALHLDTP